MKVAAKVSAALRFASLLPTVRLMAQVTAVARTPIADLSKLTFEYFCAEKFVIGNDGDKAIDSEYAIAKRTKHTKLTPKRTNSWNSIQNSKTRWSFGSTENSSRKHPTKNARQDGQGTGAVAITPFEAAERAPSRASVGAIAVICGVA